MTRSLNMKIILYSLDMKVISLISIHLSEKKSCIMTYLPCSPCRLMLTFRASSTILSGM